MISHRFEVLEQPEDWKQIQSIMENMGTQMPVKGSGIVFAEFNENDEVVAFQVVQNILCLEGLWAKDGNTNLRHIWHMIEEWMKEHIKDEIKGRTLFTIATTPKMARVAKIMGCENVPESWNLMRRVF